MSSVRIKLAAVVAVIGVAVVSTAAIAGGGHSAKTQLSGYQEVPLTLSTPATGKFKFRINSGGQQIAWKLRYSGFESDVTQAHIHFGAPATAGGISVWLCQTGQAAAPAGTPACPARSGEVSGTIAPAHVVGPADQGIAAGEFGELVAAIGAGATYANVHSTARPAGEIRGQLDARFRFKDHGFRDKGDYGEYKEFSDRGRKKGHRD